jgi:hypothetical protein
MKFVADNFEIWTLRPKTFFIYFEPEVAGYGVEERGSAPEWNRHVIFTHIGSGANPVSYFGCQRLLPSG